MKRKADGAFHPSSFNVLPYFKNAPPPGFEPGQREPKSLVLPLHYGVVAGRLRLFCVEGEGDALCRTHRRGETRGGGGGGGGAGRGPGFARGPAPGNTRGTASILPGAPP